MKIEKYKTLIANLPVRQQCFSTKRTTWKSAEIHFDWFRELNNKLFIDSKVLSISRQNIFETVDIREKIIKTIYWGYSSGMRGNHFVDILNKIEKIETTLINLKQIKKPSNEDFKYLVSEFKQVKGLGLSTYSKILYFSEISFNDNPSLILDLRLIDVFKNKTYSEFNKLSDIRYGGIAENKYLNFLHLMNDTSISLETKGENIEQFLFIFGNNLQID